MDRFDGKVAVVTGGGSGMGQALCRQLAAEGCHVATCDVDADALAVTRARCEEGAPEGTVVSTFVADVSDEAQVRAFRDATLAAHQVDHVDLVFNNAGIGGGGSMVIDPREEWERTFNVCWGGVYYGTRTFLPLLLRAPEGRLVNTSSVNGFWASLGPMIPHTAYSAAKFAVKGFSEALLTDLRLHAPHVKVSVVMPGHIGTRIAYNSNLAHGRDPKALTDPQVAEARERMARVGVDTGAMSDEDVRHLVLEQVESFQATAPMSAEEAAAVILAGVRAGEWRILVGTDAQTMDAMVRDDPWNAYEPSFLERLASERVLPLVTEPGP